MHDGRGATATPSREVIHDIVGRGEGGGLKRRGAGRGTAVDARNRCWTTGHTGQRFELFTTELSIQQRRIATSNNVTISRSQLIHDETLHKD